MRWSAAQIKSPPGTGQRLRRFDLAVCNPHGEIKVGEVVCVATGKRAADNEPAGIGVVLAPAEQPFQQPPLAAQLSREAVKPCGDIGHLVIIAQVGLLVLCTGHGA